MEIKSCLYCGQPFKTYASERQRGWGRYCCAACFNAARKANPEARFWKFVDKSAGPDDCWLWTGVKSHNGYGRFHVDGHAVPAHRFAYELVHGPVPSGNLTLHRCDNPPCVNPAHLFVGTQRDNVHDAMAKGRVAKGETSGTRLHPDKQCRGDAHWTRQHPERVLRGNANGSHMHPERTPRGDQNGQAKLTWEQVREIRRLWPTGEYTKCALGRLFGVSGVQISNIVNNRSWLEVILPTS